MQRSSPSRIILLFLLVATLLPHAAMAERVADLPMPSRYVNDFAGVLSPSAQQGMEQECQQLHTLAHADVAVVTIKQLDDGQTVEEFTTALEEKWKLGQKGSDRSAIYILVLNPHRLRVETGYGLEGILNDAKVGGILDTATAYARAGNYDATMEAGLDGLAQVIATDAHVSVAPAASQLPPPPVRQTGYGGTTRQRSGGASAVVGLLVLGFVLLMLFTGNGGVLFSILFSLLGNGGYGGGYRGGRRDDDGGFGGGFGGGDGGFGGSDGGESGGGGASRDF